MWSKTVEVLDPYKALMESKNKEEKEKTVKKSGFKDFLKFAAIYAKTLLLFIVMGIGFFTIYSVAWITLGIPVYGWTGLFVVGLTVLTEFGYFKWAMGGLDNEEK